MKINFSEREILIGGILLIIFIGLVINLLWASPSNVGFCGDGICKKSEMKTCQIDCDWCGDGYCQEGEACNNCPEDCRSCSAASFCGDGTCGINECEIGCWKDCSYSQCENGVCEQEKGENCAVTPSDCRCINGYCDTKTLQCVYQSCGNEICENHETYLNCPNDCKAEAYKSEDTSNINYPIVFIHGHSPAEKDNADYSINAFKEFQEKLEVESLYADKGVLLPSAQQSALERGVWGKSQLPVSVRSTYYLGVYDERGSIIGTEDEQSISTYADRLKVVADNLKYYTGKNKVIIIAHSMGGLVAREYIRRYGSENVDTLITVGTPNHGFYKEDLYKYLITIFINCKESHPGPECIEMSPNSTFLNRLNENDETPGSTKYITIAGDCCSTFDKRWDETIRVESVKLDGATNIVVNGDEVSGLDTFHGALIHPSKVPEVYNRVRDVLEESHR